MQGGSLLGEERTNPKTMTVLVVDDDSEWADTTGAALEAVDDEFSVITATSGLEALDLIDGESFDCVVCDYRMPNLDGLALLERIRATYGDMPFILVTSVGNESVASRAISSHVTDYFIKDPSRDQSRALAMRIRSAVRADRRKQSAETARRRFTGLFENAPEPVAIAIQSSGKLRAINEAFADVFGVDREAASGKAIADVLDGDQSTKLTPSSDHTVIEGATLKTADGPRDFLVRRFRIDRTNQAEVGYIFIDRTVERNRQRRLKQLLSLSADIQSTILSADSRSGLETAVCTEVADENRFAAIAERTPSDGVTIRTATDKASRYLEVLLSDSEQTPQPGEAAPPICRALRTREQQYVPDVTTATGTWTDVASTVGIRSIFTAPLDCDGVPLGVFAVYDTEPNGFDEVNRQHLGKLVDSIGDALPFLDRRSIITADSVTRTSFTVSDSSAFLRALVPGETTVTVPTVFETGDGVTLYLVSQSTTVNEIFQRASDHPDVTDVEFVREEPEGVVRVHTTVPTIPGILSTQGCRIQALEISTGGIQVTIDSPVEKNLSKVLASVEEKFDLVSLGTTRTISFPNDRSVDAPLNDLTEKQSLALEVALREGYFDRPRRHSAVDIAETIGIAKSTYLQHLRVGQRKLLNNVFTED